MIANDDPHYIIEEYKGQIIASHKYNVSQKSIDNIIIVYDKLDFPDYGFYIGLDDSASSNESRHLDKDLTVIFEKNNKPENAQVIIPSSKQSTSNIEQSINDAMKHIDILVDNPNIISNSSVLSNALSINQYIELYHSQGNIEAKKFPKNEKSTIENPQKGKHPNF